MLDVEPELELRLDMLGEEVAEGACEEVGEMMGLKGRIAGLVGLVLRGRCS